MRSPQTIVKLIEYNSQQYWQACQLGYRLFYAEHSLSWNLVFNKNKRDCFHLAIANSGNVLAYGQLYPQHNPTYQIKQMVVRPSYQTRGLGKQILRTAIDLAKEQDAISLSLNCRLSAISFYRKQGFQTHGVEFPSSTTGVMHVAIKLEL